MNAFNQLPLVEKVRLLKLRGSHVSTISFQEYSVSLYRVNNFLVEKYVDQSSKKIAKIQSTEYLDLIKYLPHITINSLYNLIA